MVTVFIGRLCGISYNEEAGHQYTPTPTQAQTAFRTFLITDRVANWDHIHVSGHTEIEGHRASWHIEFDRAFPFQGSH